MELEMINKIENKNISNIKKKVNESTTLKKLDTAIVVPFYNYTNLNEYYNECSSYENLKKVKKPLLCISSKSDAHIDENILNEPIKASSINENLLTVVTEYGGHCAWIDNLINDQWHIRLIFEYFKSI
jgi:predicted alpha/beta-fold hydrolase